MKNTSIRLDGFKDSIFGTMSRLARENQAINLSQGFPDFDGPEWVKKIAQEKIQEGHNQYAPFHGTPSLRQAIANYYQSFYKLDYDMESEITVTAGATEALFCSILGLTSPGDEVIVLEPFYDSYTASIKMAGGIPIPVTLHAPDFSFDPQELEAAVSPKTKMIIFNNPHNPSGKVFKREEIEVLAHLVEKHDLYLISDEVYEFLVFDGHKHLPSACVQNLKDRTITISSAGKTFGLTGWKIGWTLAPKHLSHAIRLVHQYVTFAVSTPIQEAVAVGLANLHDYVPGFVSVYQEKRDYFYKGLQDLGFDFANPAGTYFMMVPLEKKTTLKDVEFAMELVTKRKVASVPPTAFYLKSNQGEKYLRFCFAKKQETLKAALDNLQGL